MSQQSLQVPAYNGNDYDDNCELDVFPPHVTSQTP